ncbi:MAG: hypothetical protein U0O24_05485, partial [Eggerthellaceae bacterium]
MDNNESNVDANEDAPTTYERDNEPKPASNAKASAPEFESDNNAKHAPDVEFDSKSTSTAPETEFETQSATSETIEVEAVVLDENGNPTSEKRTVKISTKAMGAAQVAAGTVLTIAGVPMLILPGPGVVALAGGAALLSKGQRNLTGRTATPIEEKLDETAAKLSSAAKEQAKS